MIPCPAPHWQFQVFWALLMAATIAWGMSNHVVARRVRGMRIGLLGLALMSLSLVSTLFYLLFPYVAKGQ